MAFGREYGQRWYDTSIIISCSTVLVCHQYLCRVECGDAVVVDPQ